MMSRDLISRNMVLVLVLAGGLLTYGCGSPPDRNLPPEFATPVAEAQRAGMVLYWLGERFEAEGYTFRATGARFEDPEQPSFLRIYYQAEFEGDGSIGAPLVIYSPEGWDEANVRVIPRIEGVSRQDITVRGWRGELFSIAQGRWVNILVVVDAPDAVIVAGANASFANFQQVDPLNNPDRLLALLEDLRRYPQ